MENLLFLGVPILKHIRVVLVNPLGDLSLPRNSVVRLTDRPDLTIAVYQGHKATTYSMKKTDRSQSFTHE